MKMKEYYNGMTDDTRMRFWNMATNFVVVIITFWIGLSIQYIVYNHNEDEARKLTHYQVVDKVYPTYEKTMRLNGDLIGALRRAMASNNQQQEVSKVIANNLSNINKLGEATVQLTEKFRLYLPQKQVRLMNQYNMEILVGSKLIDLAQKNRTNKINIRDSLERYLTSVDFTLYIGGVIPKEELLAKCETLINNNQGRRLEMAACGRFIIGPLLKNMNIMGQELLMPDSNYICTIIVCVVFLLASLLVGFVIFRILIGRIFGNNPKLSDGTRQLKEAKDEITVLKAALHSKDDEIEMYQGKIDALLGKLKKND